MPCNQEAAGRGRERARGSPGPHRRGHRALPPPGLSPPPRSAPRAGRAALTYLATDHRGGGREGQRGPQAAAAPRRPGRSGALSHSRSPGTRGTRGTRSTGAPQHSGRGGRRSPPGGKLGWAPARPRAEPLALGAGRGEGRTRALAPPLGPCPEG